ncbi:TetR family transcriptional regulator C-terminal domain-containing protein [Robertkochia aurantiaca]|uniref:TetR family transcriptional regulator C-terminal domain-containing protein n=1 Tax=Robertkochia aurantiaca TaxID=2873700 RepID=UPI001CCF46CB|nr:TetR family transcriptional regulator C-terminal domain-containing protein [Robertkochia sp. 3YJGBD-33]
MAPTKKKNDKIKAEDIMTAYMNHVLETEDRPKSVYRFCKDNQFEETDFYQHFGSFDSLRKQIWQAFFDNAMQAAQKDKDYAGYSNREKMLTFFFTFFEVLKLNRSYILYSVNEAGGSLKHLEQLKGLRRSVKDFARELIEERNAERQIKLTQRSPEIFSEGAWVQLMFLLRFWLNDDSPGFEKTDVAIEKSVNTIFDVFDNTPLDNIVDLGKFLWKETFA